MNFRTVTIIGILFLVLFQLYVIYYFFLDSKNTRLLSQDRNQANPRTHERNDDGIQGHRDSRRRGTGLSNSRRVRNSASRREGAKGLPLEVGGAAGEEGVAEGASGMDAANSAGRGGQQPGVFANNEPGHTTTIDRNLDERYWSFIPAGGFLMGCNPAEVGRCPINEFRDHEVLLLLHQRREVRAAVCCREHVMLFRVTRPGYVEVTFHNVTEESQRC